jgi:hypothetical protein
MIHRKIILLFFFNLQSFFLTNIASEWHVLGDYGQKAKAFWPQISKGKSPARSAGLFPFYGRTF